MKAINVIKAVQSLLNVEPDGDFKTKSRKALMDLLKADLESEWVFKDESKKLEDGKVLGGDGTWPWQAFVVGDDIEVRNVRCTCFGGSNDPQDSGETASGVSTKSNPSILGCALPMDGRMFPKLTPAERKALDGSPIPRLPWKMLVSVKGNDKSLTVPVIDLGPAKRTGNAIDLTVAAAKFFKPNASATNFEMMCDYRILNGAKHVPIVA